MVVTCDTVTKCDDCTAVMRSESSFDKSKKAIKVFGVYIGRLLESWNIHAQLTEGLTYTCWMTQKRCRNDAKNIYRKVVRH